MFEQIEIEREIHKRPWRQNKISIYINESLSFDTNKFFFHIRNKSRTLIYNTVITDNGLIKVKTINESGDYKRVKIANSNNLDKSKVRKFVCNSIFTKYKTARRYKSDTLIILHNLYLLVRKWIL